MGEDNYHIGAFGASSRILQKLLGSRSISDAKKLKEFEKENSRLKKLETY